MTPVLLDWESRSYADLKAVGGPAYVAHPSTEVLCGAALLPDGERVVWSPWSYSPVRGAVSVVGTPIPPLRVLDACREHGVATHNAEGFDRLVWEALGLPEVRWFDTLPRVRRRGLPGKLTEKDQRGKKIMLLLSRPRRGKLMHPAPAPLTAVVRYCLQDVLALADLAKRERLFEPHADDPTLELDARINRRGVHVDRAWVEAILRESRDLVAAALRRAEEALRRSGWDGDDVGKFLRSPKQLLPWLRRQGFKGADCRRDTLLAALDTLTPDGAAVAEARTDAVRVTAGKLNRMLDQAVDGRLTHLFAYHSAHTGRWGGRGVQPQNFPGLPAGCGDATPETAGAVAERARVPYAAVLGGLVKRSLVPAPGHVFVNLDLSSVEARGVLWLADDLPGVEEFRFEGKPDVYMRMAGRILGIDPLACTKAQRQVGKAVTLSSGYAGGAGALLRGAGKIGVTEADLAAMGVDPDAAVQAWRDAHPAVAGVRTGGMIERDGRPPIPARKGGLWKRLLRGARKAVEFGTANRVGRVGFEREGKHLVIVLPSGRPLIYRDARIEPVVPPWGGDPRPTITWTSPRGVKRMSPSVCVENVVQALCRDLFVHGMLLAEEHDLPVAIHVHDGVAFEAPRAEAAEAEELARACMTHLPPWAEGFPLAVEGGILERFE